MKPWSWKGETMPLGKRRESDRDGYHQRNELADMQWHTSKAEPVVTTLREIQFWAARVRRVDARDANGINSRDGEYEE